MNGYVVSGFKRVMKFGAMLGKYDFAIDMAILIICWFALISMQK